MPSVRDFISHEWQTVGALQVALEKQGIVMSEYKLMKLLENMPCIAIDPHSNLIRQIPYTERKP